MLRTSFSQKHNIFKFFHNPILQSLTVPLSGILVGVQTEKLKIHLFHKWKPNLVPKKNGCKLRRNFFQFIMSKEDFIRQWSKAITGNWMWHLKSPVRVVLVIYYSGQIKTLNLSLIIIRCWRSCYMVYSWI